MTRKRNVPSHIQDTNIFDAIHKRHRRQAQNMLNDSAQRAGQTFARNKLNATEGFYGTREPVRQTDAEREASCNGRFSRSARGK